MVYSSHHFHKEIIFRERNLAVMLLLSIAESILISEWYCNCQVKELHVTNHSFHITIRGCRPKITAAQWRRKTFRLDYFLCLAIWKILLLILDNNDSEERCLTRSHQVKSDTRERCLKESQTNNVTDGRCLTESQANNVTDGRCLTQSQEANSDTDERCVTQSFKVKIDANERCLAGSHDLNCDIDERRAFLQLQQETEEKQKQTVSRDHSISNTNLKLPQHVMGDNSDDEENEAIYMDSIVRKITSPPITCKRSLASFTENDKMSHGLKKKIISKNSTSVLKSKKLSKGKKSPKHHFNKRITRRNTSARVTLSTLRSILKLQGHDFSSEREKSKASKSHTSEIDSDTDDVYDIQNLYSVLRIVPPKKVFEVYIAQQPLLMVEEFERVSSLVNYQSPPPDIWLLRLAQAGFYFLQGSASTLRCAFCDVAIAAEHFRGRNPVEVHEEFSPDCSFLRDHHIRNTSIQQRGELLGQRFIQMAESRKANRQQYCSQEQPGIETPHRSQEQPEIETPHRSQEQPRIDTPHRSQEQPRIDTPHRSQEQPRIDTPHRSQEQPRIDTPHRSQEQPRIDTPHRSQEQPRIDTPHLSQEQPRIDTPHRSQEQPRIDTPHLSKVSEGGHHRVPYLGHSSSADQSPQTNYSADFGQPSELVWPLEPQTDGQAVGSVSQTLALQGHSACQSERQTAVTNQSRTDTAPYQTARYIEPRPQTSSAALQTARNARDPEIQQPRIQSTLSNSNQQQTPLRSETAISSSAREAAGSGEQTNNTSTLQPPSSAGTETPHQANNTSTQQPPSSAGSETRVVTYAQLGIITARPKRPDLAVASVRSNTFKSNWPHAGTHSPERMAEAGFYFTENGDLVRCFYCKHGLKSWSEQLDPWVEHARWFSDCPFVLQVKGANYVDAVQALHNKTKEKISPSDVEDEMKNKRRPSRQGKTRVPPVSTLEDSELGAVGGAPGLVVEAAIVTGTCAVDTSTLARQEEVLKRENEEILSETICKICQTNEVNILFLPCGHLVSCAQCAPALRKCAICRQLVKGTVRVYTEDCDG